MLCIPTKYIAMPYSQIILQRWRVNRPWWDPDRLDRGRPQYSYNRSTKEWKSLPNSSDGNDDGDAVSECKPS